tara:strand:+ start:1103 stop:1252 length:150 start_codon:yes stop_codon:yes gene_type:complete
MQTILYPPTTGCLFGDYVGPKSSMGHCSIEETYYIEDIVAMARGAKAYA